MACKQADAPCQKKTKKEEEDRKRLMVVVMIIITISWSISCDESNEVRERKKSLPALSVDIFVVVTPRGLVVRVSDY